MSDTDRVLLGHIAGAHGIRGEVLIKSYTEDPAAIASYGPLHDETCDRSFVVTKTRVAAKGVIARIEGIADRTAAEALKGTSLFVDRDRLPEPDDDEFYHADLIGMAVVTTAGEHIGDVVALQNFGAGDLLEYRLLDSRRTEFLPFTIAFVPEIDGDARRVIVRLPDITDGEDHGHSAAGGKPD